jgi:hypothetical protein
MPAGALRRAAPSGVSACTYAYVPSEQRESNVVEKGIRVLLRYVVIAAARLEVVVGAVILLAPAQMSVLLFGGEPGTVGVLFARFAAVGLLGLGIACRPLQGRSDGGTLRGLLAFNVGMTVLLAWVAVATVYRGILIWPATVLHGVIAVALGQRMRSTT